jgi:hypothetical protein
MFFKDHEPAAFRRDVAPPVSGCHALDAVITARDTVPENWACHAANRQNT